MSITKQVTLTTGQQEELFDALDTIIAFAAQAKLTHAGTKEWTHGPTSSCMTIRVPTALLNRIRDVGEFLQDVRATS